MTQNNITLQNLYDCEQKEALKHKRIIIMMKKVWQYFENFKLFTLNFYTGFAIDSWLWRISFTYRTSVRIKFSYQQA
jgi:hypothetical protein